MRCLIVDYGSDFLSGVIGSCYGCWFRFSPGCFFTSVSRWAHWFRFPTNSVDVQRPTSKCLIVVFLSLCHQVSLGGIRWYTVVVVVAAAAETATTIMRRFLFSSSIGYKHNNYNNSPTAATTSSNNEQQQRDLLLGRQQTTQQQQQKRGISFFLSAGLLLLTAQFGDISLDSSYW